MSSLVRDETGEEGEEGDDIRVPKKGARKARGKPLRERFGCTKLGSILAPASMLLLLARLWKYELM